MVSNRKEGRIGQSFDDYLKAEGRYEETTIRALLSLIMETLNDIEKLVDDSVKSKSLHNCGIDKALHREVKKLDQKYQNFRKNLTETIMSNETELRA